MLKHLLIPAILVAPFAFTVACSGSDSSSSSSTALDANGDHLADDLGSFVDANKDNVADTIDINNDGVPDGLKVDLSGKGTGPFGLALDENCDGTYDSVDTTGDGVPDYQTRREAITTPAGCNPNPIKGGGHVGTAGAGNVGAGGAPSSSAGAPSSSAGAPSTSAGAPGSAGAVSHGGSTGTAGAPTGTAGASTTNGSLGHAQYQGSGSTTDRNAQFDVYRVNTANKSIGYKFIANGWGTGWKSHEISWNGTSFTVKSLNGSQGSDYSPAGYPSMFCGLYSEPGIQSDGCGLPATISSLKSVKTGWRWKSNGQNGQYNAAWDIWLGDANNKLTSYVMVWLRDPPGQQPAGTKGLSGVSVAGLPGAWTIWQGSVNGHPIINYVQPEGSDLGELEFDVMDVYKDAVKRYGSLMGTKLLAVAIGYEVWNGPISNIATDDFYVDVGM